LSVHDALNAYGIAALANINRDPKHRRDPFEIKDFLLFDDSAKQEDALIFYDDPNKQTEALIGAFGGTVIRADFMQTPDYTRQ
jgi:hypothetical protein